MHIDLMRKNDFNPGGTRILRFNLKQRKMESRLTQIMLVTTVDGRRIRVYTKLRVEPRYWDGATYRCRADAGVNQRERSRLAGINRQLVQLEQSVLAEDERLADRGGVLSADVLRRVVTHCLTGGEGAGSPLEYLRRLVTDYAGSINRRGKRGIDSTVRTYRMALERLEEYNRQRREPIRSFDDFNKSFFADFTNFLCNYRYGKGTGQRNYTLNTIVNTLKVLKNLLHRAFDDEVTQNNYFMKVQTTLPATASEQVYLQEKEIRRLAELETEEGQAREVRDMFLIACYTALRFSDLQRLNEAVIGDGVIRLYQAKTKERVAIPVLKEIAPLVEQYRVRGFPVLKKGAANRIIRDLAARCLPGEKVVRREMRGGEVHIRTVAKWELISFHTARRSCITNLYKRGYPVNYIMSLSGHRSVQAFQRYMKASSEELMRDFVRLLRKDKAI